MQIFERLLLKFVIRLPAEEYEALPWEKRLWIASRDVFNTAVVLFALSQALLLRPDNFPIIIGLNPAYVDVVTCAQFKPMIERALVCYGDNASVEMSCTARSKYGLGENPLFANLSLLE
jgi:hypothetical protein